MSYVYKYINKTINKYNIIFNLHCTKLKLYNTFVNIVILYMYNCRIAIWFNFIYYIVIIDNTLLIYKCNENLWFIWIIWNIEILLKIENIWKELYIICTYIIFLFAKSETNLTKIGSPLLILNSVQKEDSL